MLSEIYLQNFKSHKETCLHLDDSRLHALVGKNSSGKTSILQAINYFFRNGERVYRHDLDYFVRSGCSKLTVGMKTSENPWKFFYEYQRSEGGWLATIGFQNSVVSRKDLDLSGEPGDEFLVKEKYDTSSWIKSVSRAFTTRGIERQYPAYLKLDISNLMKPDYNSDLHPEMQPDGSGIASALGNLRDESPEHFECLQDMMRRVVPGVQKVKICRAEVVVKSLPYDDKEFARWLTETYNQASNMPRMVISEVFDKMRPKVIGQGIALDMTSGQSIPARSLSEGTLLTLGILTAVMSPQRSNLILLEDIQQGLHPRAQREIISILKELLQNNSELQIIFSTHSPYILDALEPSQVHVLSTAKTGFTQTKRLDEHPDSEWAKQTLTTGEFWDSTGEDWVAEA